MSADLTAVPRGGIRGRGVVVGIGVGVVIVLVAITVLWVVGGPPSGATHADARSLPVWPTRAQDDPSASPTPLQTRPPSSPTPDRVDLPAAAAFDRPPGAWDHRLTGSELRQERERGECTCPETLPGGLSRFDARRDGVGQGAAVHTSYTDGTLTLSVFEEPGELPDEIPAGFAVRQVGGHAALVMAPADGPVHVVWQAPGRVMTVVAEPAATDAVVATVATLPHAPTRQDGVMDRVRRGAGEVVPPLSGDTG